MLYDPIMPAVKPISEIVDKCKRRAGAAGQDYAAGVSRPRRSWAQATNDAAEARSILQQQCREDGVEDGAFVDDSDIPCNH